ncbi:unnamed protein product [Hyaloperonospora brassicae]|uniref:PX domain-containing protein n=1 Tax=Hyaloperonospora brassicae TaxID=162125 RepID=A0AAV0T492_HYABA|nr:unnamed protein product [Hyaloperonospora brassicae]
MWALSCGSTSGQPSTPTAFESPPMRPVAATKIGYETFLEKRAAAAELQRAAVTPVTPLERALQEDDTLVANQWLQGKKRASPAIVETVQPPDRGRDQATNRRASRTLSTLDLDELQLPDLHEALCCVYCRPSTWSPAFTSPGDFTLKMASVFPTNGEICFRIAVMCSCAWFLRDGARVKPVLKRQYYTSYVERTQREVVQLTEALALHEALDEYGGEVLQFLDSVMQITAIGFNRLVTLHEPVCNNVQLRDFLGLALSYSEQPVVATSSCDARIEGQDGSACRPVLPSAWMDANPSTSSDAIISEPWHAMKRSPRARSYDTRSVRSDWDSPVPSRRSTQPGAGKCVRYVDPRSWTEEPPSGDGSFTVEITSVSVVAGVARFTISVLYCASGRLETTAVERRYSEFDALARALEAKVPSLQLCKWLPPKTVFFRTLTVRSLERRAASLQRFLQHLLQLRFHGLLDEAVPLAAEPSVRSFLHLPAVEWVVVPWSKRSPAHAVARREDCGTNVSRSPTAASEWSQCDNTSPRRTSLVSRSDTIFVRRSDSM